MNSARHHNLDNSKEFSQQSLLSALHQFVNAVDYMDETVMIPSRLRDMDLLTSDEWITDLSGKRRHQQHRHSAPPSPTFFNVAGIKRRHSTEQQQHDPPCMTDGGNGADEQNLYNFYNLLKAIKHEVVSGIPAIPDSSSEVGHGIGGGGGGGLMSHSLEMEFGEDSPPPTTGHNSHMSAAAAATTMSATSASSSPFVDEDEDSSTVDTEEDTDSVLSDTSVCTEDSSRKVATSFRHHLRSLFGLLHQFTQTAKYLSHRYESEVGQSSASQVSSFAF